MHGCRRYVPNAEYIPVVPEYLPSGDCYGEGGFFTTATISGFYGSEWRTRTGITWGVDYLFVAPVVYLEYSVVQ